MAETVYFIGIKGTGVCALAELMHKAGVKVSGSDISEKFYTDEILNELQIPFYETFDASRITKEIDKVIYSAAYSADTNVELARAQELGIPLLKYSDALGDWSARFESAGICGVHGKTTTTAICGIIARAALLPAQILTGSAAVNFGGRSTLNLGDKYFIAETCEYRRHFLSFHPTHIILTSVESDHQDYFPTYESIRDAFVEYCRLLPQGGTLIYCADDSGACEVARIIEKENRRIVFIPYGFTASGAYKVVSCDTQKDKTVFALQGFKGDFVLHVPGKHQALNVAAALALVELLAKKEAGSLKDDHIASMKNELEDFKTTKRRSEVIGEAGGIIFMDDYGHHPTAIKTTLAGIKSFYPTRRIVASFMSHTSSRTGALLDEFAHAFNDADILFLHKIYASARDDKNSKVDGRTLFEKCASCRKGETYYVDEVDDAFAPLFEMLKEGDLFITIGAGNNWPLGKKLLEAKHG